MATERVDIIISESGAITVRKNFEDLGKSAQSASSDVKSLDSSIKTLKATSATSSSTISSTLGSSVSYLNSATTNTTASVGQMTAAVAGAGKAAGGAAPPIKTVGHAAGGAAGGFNNLTGSIFTFRNALRATLSILFLRELKEFTDQWIYFENNVRLSTKTLEESVVVLDKLFDVTMRARTDMEPMIILYRRAAQAGKELGASQQQLIEFTEGVGKALTVQGVSMKQAHGTLLQLGQLIGMARIRAQEFNSINENTPRILQAVADNLDMTGGSIHKLRLALNAQKITNEMFFQAFMRGIKKINEEFALVRPTFEQAFAVLKTGFGKWLYDINKASGASTVLTNAIIWIGRHFDSFAKILASVGSAILALFSGRIILAIRTAATSAQASIVALLGPVGLLITAISVIIGIIAIWRDDIILLNSAQASLSDHLRDASSVQVSLGDYFRATWVKIKDSVLVAIDIIKGSLNNLKSTFESVPDTLKTVMSEVGRFFLDIIKIIGGAVNFAIGVSQALINTASTAVQVIIDLVSMKSIDFEEVGQRFKAGLISAFTTDYIQEYVDKGIAALRSLTEEAERQARLRKSAEKPSVDLTGKLGAGVGAGDTDLDKLRRKFEQLVITIAPTEGVIIKVARAMEILRKTREANIITGAREEELEALLFDHYHNLLHPIEALKAEIAEEAKYVLMDRDARLANNRVMEEEAKLRREGFPVTEALTEEIRQEIDQLYRLKRVSQEVEALQNKIINPKKRLIEAEAALILLYKDGAISLQEYAREFVELTNLAGEGDFTTVMIEKMNLLVYTSKKAVQDIGAAFGDLFNQLIQGFGDSIGRAIVFGENLKTVLYEIASQALSSLISALVQVGIRLALNAMIGESLAIAAISASSAQAAALAAAWSTPAAMASLATVGANAAPAAAALTGTVALAQMLAAGTSLFGSSGGGIGAGIGAGGFEEGGFTGRGGRKQIAGVVHGQEFVMNAEATARHRPILESMNKGGVAPGVKITVNNYSSAKIEVQQITPTDIRIIAREEAKRAILADAPNVVANDIANPNGRVSTSLARNTAVQRRRG